MVPESKAVGSEAGRNEDARKAPDVSKADTIARARAVAAKLRATAKGDAASGDLAAGGLKAPEQPRRPLWEAEQKADEPPPVAPALTVAPVARRIFAGIPVVVDRPKGFVQEGKSADGSPWRRVYHVDYGHIPGTLGGDGDGLDVFVGGDETAKEVHWILQRKADGSFDEYKIMLGFADRETAKAIYCAHIPKRFLGSIATMPIEYMKALLGIEPIGIAKAEQVVRAIIESTETLDGNAPESTTEERTIKIAKAAPTPEGGELRYVLGVVLEPESVDGQGDVYSADEIRRTAWGYMTNFRNVGLMHKGLVNGKVQLVESWIAPCNLTVDGTAIKAGSWLMGLHVADDAIWDQVKRGELTGLSIGGFARRDTVARPA